MNESAVALDILPELLDKTEAYLTKYIWGDYKILILPKSFPMGGMENPLLTFASPTIITKDKSQVYVQLMRLPTLGLETTSPVKTGAICGSMRASPSLKREKLALCSTVKIFQRSMPISETFQWMLLWEIMDMIRIIHHFTHWLVATILMAPSVRFHMKRDSNSFTTLKLWLEKMTCKNSLGCTSTITLRNRSCTNNLFLTSTNTSTRIWRIRLLISSQRWIGICGLNNLVFQKILVLTSQLLLC